MVFSQWCRASHQHPKAKHDDEGFLTLPSTWNHFQIRSRSCNTLLFSHLSAHTQRCNFAVHGAFPVYICSLPNWFCPEPRLNCLKSSLQSMAFHCQPVFSVDTLCTPQYCILQAHLKAFPRTPELYSISINTPFYTKQILVATSYTKSVIQYN